MAKRHRGELSTRRPSAGQIDWNAVVMQSKEIVESHPTSMTLRQLFYRLVSLELIPNKVSAYKTLSAKTAQARREGWFPALLDRTRAIEAYGTWTSPQQSLEQTLNSYRRDRTEGQKNTLYLGVEKHGMSVQLLHWFGDLGIPVLALGGYSSQTFVDVVRDDIEKQGRPAVLIYAGDFDPSGVDIDRDFKERTEIFSEVKRIALNKTQIKKYDLPPLPAKEKDVRSARFILEHGELIQVELDALDPNDLRDLYQKAIDKFWDKKAYDKVVKQETEERRVLQDAFAIAKLDNPVSKSIFLLNDSDAPVVMEASKGQIGVLLDAVQDLAAE